jgi:hypothetical protein
MVDRRITRRVVRRVTPAALTGVAGRPTIAAAGCVSPLPQSPSVNAPAASNPQAAIIKLYIKVMVHVSKCED